MADPVRGAVLATELLGDCRDILPTLEQESVQCCVTSPPYWGLRDYGTNGQLGLESTPEEYITNMVAVFREVWRVLRLDGTLWVNMGDSYAHGIPGGDCVFANGRTDGRKFYEGNKARGREKRSTLVPGLKPKDLCGIPWHLAFALQADGWYLRSDIIWAKPNPMPESVIDRPTKAHEYIFLLTKQERYFYDAEAIREPMSADEMARTFRGGAYINNSTFDNTAGGKRTVRGNHKLAPLEGTHATLGMDGNGMRMPDKWNNPNGRNKRSVWTIATQPYAEAHFATFPEEIPKVCILAGSKPGDLVLDPFAGSGTVGKAAIELGRRAILIELNPAYIELAHERTNVTPGFF